MNGVEFRAAVLEQTDGLLSVRDVRICNLADTDVVVRIRASSICHTDLEAIKGQLALPLPLIPGHEAAGIVEWIGSAVRKVRVGDTVILSWNPYCGECFYCGHQQHILCQKYRDGGQHSFAFDGKPRIVLDDEPVHTLMYSGTFAELAVVTELCAIPVSREIGPSVACLIGCGVMTGVGAALNVVRVQPGSNTAVIGCGAVGLSAMQGARLAGAETIIAIDRDPSKLEIARRFGATHTNLADDSLFGNHLELTAGRGADYVFEAAGNEAAFRASMELVRPGGQVVWLGKLQVQAETAFRWGSLMGEKKIVRSSYGGAQPERDFPALVKAYLEGRLLLDEYVTNRIRLDDVQIGLDRLQRGIDIRSVIEFPNEKDFL